MSSNPIKAFPISKNQEHKLQNQNLKAKNRSTEYLLESRKNSRQESLEKNKNDLIKKYEVNIKNPTILKSLSRQPSPIKDLKEN